MAGLQEIVSSAVIAVLGTAIRDATDAEIERRFGSRAAQLALLGGMAWSFDPAGADGFEGELAYVVSRPSTGGAERWLTIEVTGQRARVRPGAGPNAQVTLRLQLADLVKIAAGAIEAATPLMQGRASVEGDMMLAVRIPQMFGPPKRVDATA